MKLLTFICFLLASNAANAGFVNESSPNTMTDREFDLFVEEIKEMDATNDLTVFKSGNYIELTDAISPVSYNRYKTKLSELEKRIKEAGSYKDFAASYLQKVCNKAQQYTNQQLLVTVDHPNHPKTKKYKCE